MSHELKEHDRQQGRTMAWHKLTDVQPDLTLASCWFNDWDYVATPVTLENGVKTPFRILTVSDVPDLFVGEPYNTKTFKPIFNKKLLKELHKATDDQGLTLQSAVTMFNRGRLALSFGMDAAKFQAAGREFHAFLNIGNGNDQSCPFWINTSNTCTVCNNTFTANLSSKGSIMRVKKTQFSELVIGEMGSAIQAMLSGQKSFANSLAILWAIACDAQTAREFFAGFVCVDPNKPLSGRAENTVDRLVALFNDPKVGNDGNDFSDVFQAVTDYYSHESAADTDDDKKTGAKWKQFLSSEYGAGAKSKAAAWTALTDEKERNAFIAMGKTALKATAEAPVK